MNSLHNIRKVLIANRGEIAVRIARTLRKLGIVSVAVASRDEADALHVRMADEKVILEGSNLFETYLNWEKLVQIALDLHCDAVHPGYGFLSENALFADLCEQKGVLFIGPTSGTIQTMGNKLTAREMAEKLGIPVLRSVQGKPDELPRKALDIPFPVMIKAAAGGGGKGMRIVADPDILHDAVQAASREAYAYFKDPTVYLEQFLPEAKHIEVQILGDGKGNVVHLGERECSIQRRHQKLIEESPSPSITPDVRAKICHAAVTLASAAKYRSAGTIEFLYSDNGQFFFLEMNTRIQVEHPVTEAITGADIVEAQIYIAETGHLPFSQNDISTRGHAIEARIYAEDPAEGFLPSPGYIAFYKEPNVHGMRIDSSLDRPSELSPSYDALIAKVIVHDISREQALQRLNAGLNDFIILGIQHNISYLAGIINHPDFKNGSFHTDFCERYTSEIIHSVKPPSPPPIEVVAAGMILGWFFLSETEKNYTITEKFIPRLYSVFRLRIFNEDVTVSVYSGSGGIEFKINGKAFSPSWSISDHTIHITTGGVQYTVYMSNPAAHPIWMQVNGFSLTTAFAVNTEREEKQVSGKEGMNGNELVTAPLHGKIIRIFVEENQEVAPGDLLLVLEAMKMENQIHATSSGKIEEIFVSAGMQVSRNEPLIKIGNNT